MKKMLIGLLGGVVLDRAAKTIQKVNEMPDMSEDSKHCRVCGLRVPWDVESFFSRRFVCRGCGHRTHVHCKGSLSRQLCAACLKEGRG